MAETKTPLFEREYTIPLKREWLKVARYKRTFRAVNAVKKFVAKHMKVEDRDVDKVKLDVYLNNELWFRGGKKPPTKIKVKAIKEGENVRVELAEMPEKWKFLKAYQDRIHKKTDKKKSKTEEKSEESKAEEKSEDEKKEEKEKAESSAVTQEKTMEAMAKAQKHTKFKKPTKAPLQRMALQK